MKKKIILVAAAVIIVIGGGWGIYHTNASQTDPKLSPKDIKQIVKDQYPGEIMELDLDKDFSKAVYTVAIEGEKKIYKLKMDGNTGEVLKLKEMMEIPEADKQKGDGSTSLSITEKEDDRKETPHAGKEDKNKQSADSEHQKEKQHNADKKRESKHSHDNWHKNKQKKHKNAGKQNTVISPDEALKIALKQFSGTVTELELDEDDGRYIYEIEIEDGNDREAEFEIDAMTGETISVEIDD